jgi:hypothetical protein
MDILILITIIIASIFAFVVLAFLHHVYNKSIHKINPYLILCLGYLILIINMVLATRVYSVEWAFLGFFIMTIVFYDFKIDSRFLILPALILLGYVPFLLIGKLNPLAETIAIYVYYFLVVGVGLQIFEHIKEIRNSIDFETFFNQIMKKHNLINTLLIIFGLISIIAIITNRFIYFELAKWTSVYSFVVVGIIYLISLSKK